MEPNIDNNIYALSISSNAVYLGARVISPQLAESQQAASARSCNSVYARKMNDARDRLSNTG
jgi:hypothetical protein